MPIEFFLLAVPAVMIAGISKGGIGGGLGVMAVPMMALVISPVQAAGIMLPILCAMDLFGLWAYRRRWDRTNIVILIPASIVGIVVGAATFHYFDARSIRLLIGGIAVAFTVNWLVRQRIRAATEQFSHSPWIGRLCGALAGFTSFVAHAGSPPVNIYLLPQRLDRTVYQATTVIFFAVVNYVKLIPYAWLGQLNAANLTTSLLLLPLVPVGMGLGIWLHKRVNDVFFYRVCYLFLFVTGCKLIYDGVIS